MRLLMDNLTGMGKFIPDLAANSEGPAKDKEPVDLIIRAGVIEGTQLLSEERGAIRHLLLTHNVLVQESVEFASFYQDLLVKMPGVEITILTNDLAAAKTFFDEIASVIARYRPLPRLEILEDPYQTFDLWAADKFLVLLREEFGLTTQKILFLPDGTNRDERPYSIAAHIKSLIEQRPGPYEILCVDSGLDFLGGNLLCGDDFVLIGKRVKVQNHEVKLLEETLSEYFGGKKIIWIESGDFNITRPENEHLHDTKYYHGDQPIYHLDLFLTLAGRDDQGNPVVVVGFPEHKIPEEQTELHRFANEQVGAMRLMLNEVINDLLSLKQEGPQFVIKRIPMPLHVYVKGKQQIRFDYCLKRNEKFVWYWMSYNNCLVQNDPVEGRKVWLPTYGHGILRQDFECYDHHSRLQWQSLGYEVIQLGDCTLFAARRGGLHCVAKVLDRRST